VFVGIGVWMGGHNEEIRGGSSGDVVAGHSNASLFVQVCISADTFFYYILASGDMVAGHSNASILIYTLYYKPNISIFQ
jgi:hypothetical protein